MKTTHIFSLVFASLFPLAHGAPFGYAITDTGLVGTIDINSGAFHSLGCVPVVCPPEAFGGGIAFGPGGAIEVYDLATQNLYRFNPNTAAVTLVGNTGKDYSVIAGLGDGGIFGVDLIGNLYRINATTAVSSLVAHLFDFSPDG